MTFGAVTADGRSRILADGNQMPVLGLGVWRVPSGAACVNAVRCALGLGYRHIDTAQVYGNEESVGQALRDSGVPRREIFVTTKFYPGRKYSWRRNDPIAAAEHSLRRLGVDQPTCTSSTGPAVAPLGRGPGWSGRESWGSPAQSACPTSTLANSKTDRSRDDPPSGQQVQFSPLEYRRALLDDCRRRNVAVEAYSPLGSGRHLSNETVNRGRTSNRGTPAQVLLHWCLQRELLVIPKSVHPDRIAESSQIFDFALSDEDMVELDALDQTDRTDGAQERQWW